MDNEHFPHVDVDKELYFRDQDFVNYHINHDKWAFLIRDFDIINSHRLCLDFDDYSASNWVITTTEDGSGSAAETCIDFINGVLLVTNDDATGDSDELVWAYRTFCIAKSFPLYFETRLKLTDVSLQVFWAGLVDYTGGYFGGSVLNGVYFLWDGTVLYAVVMTAGSSVAHPLTDVLADLTWVRLGIHWDGDSTVRFFVFDDSVPPQICSDQHFVTAGYPVPDTILLAPGFGIQNIDASAEAIYVDYFKCVQRRAIGEDVDEANGRQ